MFAKTFFNEYYKNNTSYVFTPEQVVDKLKMLMRSTIENFDQLFPNFPAKFTVKQQKELLEDLTVLNAYHFLDKHYLLEICQMRRPLKEIHHSAHEVSFLMENYAGLRNMFPFLKLMFRMGIIKHNQLLTASIKKALEDLQNQNHSYDDHFNLLSMILNRSFSDEESILSVLQCKEPGLMIKILNIFSEDVTKNMLLDFFEIVGNWELQSPQFRKKQLQLLNAMVFFKEDNTNVLTESGLFVDNDMIDMMVQAEIFKYFRPNKSHVQTLLSVADPCAVVCYLIDKTAGLLSTQENIEGTLDAFLKLLEIYPGEYNESLLDKTLRASVQFIPLLVDLNHPLLTQMTERMWHQLVDIAIQDPEHIVPKARHFIERLEQGQRFRNFEINTFSFRYSPFSVAESPSPMANFELEDRVSSPLNYLK